jgi:phosphate starvation-inducible PhoH-like protein
LNSDDEPSQHTFILEPNDTRALAVLCGQFDQHLRQIEQRLGVTLTARGNHFCVEGEPARAAVVGQLLARLYEEICQGIELSPESLHLQLQQLGQSEEPADGEEAPVEALTVIRTKRVSVKPRGRNQQAYVRSIGKTDVNFGIGPAGTGKTYLAVACAVEALLQERVRRILLVRPAVEAGEKLGYLPGDLSQKIDPYLRPLYDALYEMLGFDTVNKYIERNIIEVAPLAFMRGRTLNNSFIILDEAQNTTREQMKMFLTRIGFGSTAVVTGDATQIDLPRGSHSGLTHIMNVLDGIEGLGFTYFQARDVVRHPLVQRIVEAYDEHDAHRTSSLDRGRGHTALDRSGPVTAPGRGRSQRTPGGRGGDDRPERQLPPAAQTHQCAFFPGPTARGRPPAAARRHRRLRRRCGTRSEGAAQGGRRPLVPYAGARQPAPAGL